jgi:hypothetical protein
MVFVNTVNAIGSGNPNSGDERAIKAAYNSFARSSLAVAGGISCYRKDAAVSVIVISDEDERSVGGNPAMVKPQDAPGSYQPLEAQDLPANLITEAATVFGASARFTFNSIIVVPGDKACEAYQDEDVSPSHPGYTYQSLSVATGGGVGSICDNDYTANLNTFKDKVINSLSVVNLDCIPVKGSVQVQVDGADFANYTLSDSTVTFTKALSEGTQLMINYECPVQ